MLTRLMLILSLFGLMATKMVAEDSADKNNPPVVFSEFTVDDTPGTEGSWIELYNRSDKIISIAGYTIVCNNQKIFTFPPNSKIGYSTVILINFKSQKEKKTESRYCETYYSKCNNLVRLDPKKIKKTLKATQNPIISKRTPGYIALFKSPELKNENLVDVIYWGEFYANKYPNKINKNYEKWTKNTYSLLVGVDPYVCRGLPFIGDKVVVQRRKFNYKNYLQPIAFSISEATPGKGNTWKTPYFYISSENKKIKIELKTNYWDPDYNITYNDFFGDEILEMDVQIATDPHFENIVYSKHITSYAPLNKCVYSKGVAIIKDFVWDKKYNNENSYQFYIRIRINSKKVSTDDWFYAKFFFENEEPYKTDIEFDIYDTEEDEEMDDVDDVDL